MTTPRITDLRDEVREKQLEQGWSDRSLILLMLGYITDEKLGEDLLRYLDKVIAMERNSD